jgi:hypothetical protein
MRKRYIDPRTWKNIAVRYGVRTDRVDPVPPLPDPNPPAPPEPDADEVQRAKYEADVARAEGARLKKQLEEIQKQLPSQEDRARWSQLELEAQNTEEERKRKSGEFDSWRSQIEAKHAKALDDERQVVANAQAAAAATEKELNDTLIGLAFSGATEWFGEAGKTVLLPEIAQSYFAGNVAIEVLPGVNGGPARRRVIVRGMNGTNIVDLKTGQPAAFDQAIGELIESHPRRKHIMRGSGKVGSGSAGGDNGLEGKDLANLKPSDFKDQKIRDAVRDSLAAPGGLQVGPGFDKPRGGSR